jgi:hypothetical protein
MHRLITVLRSGGYEQPGTFDAETIGIRAAGQHREGELNAHGAFNPMVSERLDGWALFKHNLGFRIRDLLGPMEVDLGRARREVDGGAFGHLQAASLAKHHFDGAHRERRVLLRLGIPGDP